MSKEENKREGEQKNKNEKEKQTNAYKKVAEISNKKLIIVGVSVFLLVVIIGCIWLFTKANQIRIKSIKLKNIVYKRIYFDKFIVAKNITPKENSVKEYIAKGVVFHLKGYVDVEFPLEDFELKGDTLIYKKSWNINGLGIKGKVLPYQLTIVVPSKNIHKVYEIKPKKISPEEAEKIGKAAGIILAPIGGYFFAKMGGLAGGTVCAFISKYTKRFFGFEILNPYIDLQQLYQLSLRKRYLTGLVLEERGLDEMAKELGIEVEKRHNAMCDCLISAFVFLYFVKTGINWKKAVNF